LLRDAQAHEIEILSAVRVQANHAVLHTDASVMPKRQNAWAAWNFQSGQVGEDASKVCLHYWLNCLQPLPFEQDVFVTLNPISPIDKRRVLGEYAYDHPVLDELATKAQSRLNELNSIAGPLCFAGAWMGYGFHEDGFQAGTKAARDLLESINIIKGRHGA
jgi:predicted NAD/FAD-binding protein